MDEIRVAATAIDRAESRPAIAVWQNNGQEAGQKIPHLHFHIAGTLPGRGTDFGSVSELSIEETDEIAARLNQVAVRDIDQFGDSVRSHSSE
jgi:histidine triad (HIT) family protein